MNIPELSMTHSFGTTEDAFALITIEGSKVSGTDSKRSDRRADKGTDRGGLLLFPPLGRVEPS